MPVARMEPSAVCEIVGVNAEFSTLLCSLVARSWQRRDAAQAGIRPPHGGPTQPQRGLVLVSSMAGRLPAPLCAVYGATKAYLVSLAWSLKLELPNVSVHVSCPGMVAAGNTVRWFGEARCRQPDVATPSAAAHGILCWLGSPFTLTSTTLRQQLALWALAALPPPLLGRLVLATHNAVLARLSA